MNVMHLSHRRKNEYTTFDIVRLFDIKRNRLQPWLDAGFIVPSIQKSTRKGTKNLFSKNDLYRIRLFTLLLDAGMTRKEAAIQSLIRFNKEKGKKGTHSYRIYKVNKALISGMAGGGSDFERGEGYYSDKAPTVTLQRSDLFAIVINIQAVKDDVDAILAEKEMG